MPIQPLLGTPARGGSHSGSSLGTSQHPSACSTTREELRNTQCLHTQSAWSSMLLLSAFVNSSDYYIQPLKILTYFSLSSLPSLCSWHDAASNSSFNPKKLPSANDGMVALLVACTVSSLPLSFTSCVAINLAWLNQPARPANSLNNSQGEPYFLDMLCFIYMSFCTQQCSNVGKAIMPCPGLFLSLSPSPLLKERGRAEHLSLTPVARLAQTPPRAFRFFWFTFSIPVMPSLSEAAIGNI